MALSSELDLVENLEPAHRGQILKNSLLAKELMLMLLR